MKITLTKDLLEINFSTTKKILSLKGSFKIPLKHIQTITTQLPKPTWKEIKAPGTMIPGLIKAGTYYTDKGKQFWFVTKARAASFEAREISLLSRTGAQKYASFLPRAASKLR